MKFQLPKYRICSLFILVACISAGLAGTVQLYRLTSLTTLSERLQRLCTDKSRNYHLLLHDATHDVRRMILGRPWSKVEPELRQQGLRQIHARDYSVSTGYRYLVTHKGWWAGDMTAHSLYLDFEVDNARPELVLTAQAVLMVKPNLEYSQVLSNNTYPDGSVVFLALRLPEVVEAAREYPILKATEVSYDFIRDRWSTDAPQGFSVRLIFGDSPRGDLRGKSFTFTAISSLDSANQNWQTKLLATQFEPQDNVGELLIRGGSEWKWEP